MKIAVGKFGKSVLFNRKNWGAIGGDLDAPLMIQLVAKMNPQHEFYLIGHSDYQRLSDEQRKEVNPHGNIIDVWADHDRKTPYTPFLLEWFDKKGIKLDTACLHSGIAGNANIPDAIKTVKGDRIAKVLFCFKKYTGPIVHLLNVTKLPYFTVSVDPRYTPLMARDLFNIAKFSISQINGYTEKKRKHIKSYEDQTFEFTSVSHIYAGIETLFMVQQQKPTWEEYSKPKEKGFVVVLNEGGNGAWKRGPILKEYVLDATPNVEIYGKWSDEWMKDPRFKGTKKFTELESTLKGTKYSFIIPIEEGWVTAKFWEMAAFGIVPFFHPTYDTQKNIKCPEFLRCSSPAQLKNKIDILENDKVAYEILLKQLYDMLEDKYYDGSHINEVIMYGCNKITGGNLGPGTNDRGN